MRTEDIRVLRDLPYLEAPASPSQRLDLWLPTEGCGWPLLMFIHGGAWVSGDKSACAGLGRAMAERGIACALMNYRLSARAPDSPVRHPMHARDGAAAFAFLRRHAGEHAYSAEKIFIGGHSAGAHMAACLALDPSLLAERGENPADAAGFLGLQGIYDVPRLAEVWPGYPEWFLNGAFGPERAAWRAASPRFMTAPPGKPWLLVHSPQDELVDAAQSEDFCAHLRALGEKVRYETPASASHFAVVEDVGREGDALAEILADFLKGEANSPIPPP
jgi:acetyl esterase/lipase